MLEVDTSDTGTEIVTQELPQPLDEESNRKQADKLQEALITIGRQLNTNCDVTELEFQTLWRLIDAIDITKFPLQDVCTTARCPAVMQKLLLNQELSMSLFQKQVQQILNKYKDKSSYQKRAKLEEQSNADGKKKPSRKPSCSFQFTSIDDESERNIFKQRKQAIENLEEKLTRTRQRHDDAELVKEIKQLSETTFKDKKLTGTLKRSTLFEALTDLVHRYERMEKIITKSEEILKKLGKLSEKAVEISKRPVKTADHSSSPPHKFPTCTAWRTPKSLNKDGQELIKEIQSIYQRVKQLELKIRETCDTKMLADLPLLKIPKKDEFKDISTILTLINTLTQNIKDEQVLCYAYYPNSVNSELVKKIKDHYNCYQEEKNEIAQKTAVHMHTIQAQGVAIKRLSSQQLIQTSTEMDIDSQCLTRQQRPAW